MSAPPETTLPSRGMALAALAKNPLLAKLPPGGVERVLDLAEIASVPPGATVVREGDRSGEMYFVLTGEARLRRHELALEPIGAGGHFGALGLLTREPRTVTVTAGPGLTVARLDPARWDELVGQHPRIAVSLLTALLVHVREDLVEMTDSVGLLLQGRTLPRAREVTARLGSGERRVPTGTPLRRLLPGEVGGRLVVAGLLNQKPVSLNTPLFADAEVAPLTIDDSEGRQVWVRSLGLVLLEAAHRVAPGLEVRIGASRGPVQLVHVVGAADLASFAERLAATMRDIVEADAPFRQEIWAVEEAQDHFQERGWENAARLLATQRQGAAPLVTCGELYAVAMGPFLPSAGSLRGWSLSTLGERLVIDYGRNDPRSENGVAAAAALAAEPAGAMVRAHRAWLDAMGVRSVGAFNDLCISGGVAQMIRVSEGFHEKRIGAIADEIAARRDSVRVIAIAGPSSSGKTTFIKRLTVQLQIDGIHPVGLSLDDYYVDREKTVRDEVGEYDFEALEALDLPLLQDHVARLLAGEEVATARYDFRTGKSHPSGGQRIRLVPGDVLMLEGIHGLNPKLLGAIPREGELYRVFIHPVTTLPFDRLSRVSATDLRLVRRIVRDRHQRGYRADENILRWPSVLRGERKHIFPFLEEADAIFDSSLAYEPAVLKVYAERYLLEVPRSSAAYGTAWRLRLLVDRFISIYPDHVPPTSIIREFIGGSGFEY